MRASVLLAFGLLERNRPGSAALAIACGFYVKLYPALGALAFVFYPRRLRFLGALGAWLLVLGAIPLAVVSPEKLRALYESWLRLLFADRESVRAHAPGAGTREREGEEYLLPRSA